MFLGIHILSDKYSLWELIGNGTKYYLDELVFVKLHQSLW